MTTPPRALHEDNMTCGSIEGFTSPVNFGICAFPSWQVNAYSRGVLETCCGGTEIIPSTDGCFFYCGIKTTKDVDEFKSCLNNIPSPEWQDYFNIKCSNIMGAALGGGSATTSGKSSGAHPNTLTQTIFNSGSSAVSSVVTQPSGSNMASISSTITITSTSNGSPPAVTAISSPNFVNSTFINSTISIPPSSVLNNSSSTNTGKETLPTSITAPPPTDIPTAPPAAAPTSSTSTSIAGHTSALNSIGTMVILSLTVFSALNL